LSRALGEQEHCVAGRSKNSPLTHDTKQLLSQIHLMIVMCYQYALMIFTSGSIRISDTLTASWTHPRTPSLSWWRSNVSAADAVVHPGFLDAADVIHRSIILKNILL